MRFWLAIFWLMAIPVNAAELQVYPLRLALTAAAPIAAFRLTNSGIDPTRVQLTVSGWDQDETSDIFSLTRDIIANPPLFEVGSKREQTVRIGLKATASGPDERAYRAFFQEVPAVVGSQNGIQTLLRVSIPIFVPPEHPSKPQLNFSVANGAKNTRIVTIRNPGNVHVQILKLLVSGPGGETLVSQAMSLYVLPGRSQRWQSEPLTHDWPGHCTFAAETDQGKITGAAAPLDHAGPTE